MPMRRTPADLAAGDTQEPVRLALTRRHELPDEAALVLARDNSSRVRIALTEWIPNPAAAMVLTADDDPDIRLHGGMRTGMLG